MDSQDGNSFGVSESQEYETGNFDTSWNEILGLDNSIFDESDSSNLTYLLNENVAQEVEIISPTELENVLANSQIIPTESSQELVDIIKDEVIEADNTLYVSSTNANLSAPASLPASQNWPGVFDFQVSFNPQEKKTKGVSWTFNNQQDKLFVGKEAPCPINFSTSFPMPEGAQIRAMALYSSPDSVSEVVERCVNHLGEDRAKNIFDPEHLVRCESPMAMYEINQSTKRHSVIIPYDNPPPGQSYSTYIFKFTCFSSCPGPNRRPLMLVFSLEIDNQVVGRRKIDLKICACPGRDSKTEEQQAGPSKKRKKKSDHDSTKTSLVSTNSPSHVSKKSKGTPDQEGPYKLLVTDKKCFEFLKQMEKFYYIRKTIKSMPPEVQRYIEQYNQRKGYPMNFPDE